jgi:hypothetical protein
MYTDIAMHAPPHKAFRLGTLMFAALLGLQCVWLVLPELSRPGIDHLPTDAQAATRGARQRKDAVWAAWSGAIRGDLWAESAFTSADLLWPGSDPGSPQNAALESARAELDKALVYAPHQADAWLLLAGLEERYPSHKSDPAEALKMSYYTGPSERPLIPLRLRIATRLDALDDIEVQQFIRRDLRLLLARQQTFVVAEAYAGASPVGKRFIEQTVGEIDPAYLGLLRAGTQKP